MTLFTLFIWFKNIQFAVFWERIWSLNIVKRVLYYGVHDKWWSERVQLKTYFVDNVQCEVAKGSDVMWWQMQINCSITSCHNTKWWMSWLLLNPIIPLARCNQVNYFWWISVSGAFELKKLNNFENKSNVAFCNIKK